MIRRKAFLSGRISAGSSAGKILASYFVPVLNLFFLGIFASSTGVIGYTMTALIASVTFTVCYLIHLLLLKVMMNQRSIDENAKRQFHLKTWVKACCIKSTIIIVLIFDFIKLIGYYTLMATVAYYAVVYKMNQQCQLY
ncbi:MAG: hypothetical protein ACLTG7_07220 [Romboutsia sp.]